MPAAEPRVFISYKHGPMTPVAQKFYNKLKINGPGMGLAGTFMDAKVIAGGDLWREQVQQALEASTRFVAFLEDDYWLSDECQNELRRAVERFTARDGMKLLFVKAGEIAPELLLFDAPAGAATGAGRPEDETRRQLKRVGDLQFLGPFNDMAQLITLVRADDPKLDAQLFQLMKQLQASLV